MKYFYQFDNTSYEVCLGLFFQLLEEFLLILLSFKAK